MHKWGCVVQETMEGMSRTLTSTRHSVSPMEVVDLGWGQLECESIWDMGQ